MRPGSREIRTANIAITWLGAAGEREATGTVASIMPAGTTLVMYLPDASLIKLHSETAISKSARSAAPPKPHAQAEVNALIFSSGVQVGLNRRHQRALAPAAQLNSRIKIGARRH